MQRAVFIAQSSIMNFTIQAIQGRWPEETCQTTTQQLLICQAYTTHGDE